MSNDIVDHQFFKTYEDTKEWLDDMGVEEYEIQDDLTVNATADVDLSSKYLKFIPVQFGSIIGSFCVQYNRLTTLKGSPHTVTNAFDCSNNQLTSLEFSPKEIGNSFECQYNRLISLRGCTQEILDEFNCSNNYKLTSLRGGPKTVEGDFFCIHNDLNNLNFLPKYIKGQFVLNQRKKIMELEPFYDDYGKIEVAFEPLKKYLNTMNLQKRLQKVLKEKPKQATIKI